MDEQSQDSGHAAAPTDELRLEFEDAMRKLWTPGYGFPRNRNGDYEHVNCDLAWRVWQVARALAAPAPTQQPRFFMDHGMWHDRETGQHLYTQDQHDAELRALNEENRQLARALREAVEPPTFMGEPVSPRGVPPSDGGQQ